jgi:hypothetical protein
MQLKLGHFSPDSRQFLQCGCDNLYDSTLVEDDAAEKTANCTKSDTNVKYFITCIASFVTCVKQLAIAVT